MKILNCALPILTAAILSGCATAGSTISQVNQQSYEIGRQLDNERTTTKNYEAEKRQLDRQIASLKARERQLSQSPSSGTTTSEIAQIRGAIQKLEQQRSSLIETVRVANNANF